MVRPTKEAPIPDAYAKLNQATNAHMEQAHAHVLVILAWCLPEPGPILQWSGKEGKGVATVVSWKLFSMAGEDD